MKSPLQVTPSVWLRHVFASGTTVRVDLDGIAGVFRLPRREFRSQARLGEHLFWHLAEGRAEGMVAGRPCLLEAGATLWVSPGEAFDFRFESGRRHVVHRFRLRVTCGGRSVRLPEALRVAAAVPGLRGWFERLIGEAFAADAVTDARTRGLVACLTAEMFRLEAAGGGPAEPGRAFDAAQRRSIAEWLAAHVGDGAGPAALARHLGLTHDYFTRRFRATYGRPPRRWLVEERMRLAAQQLAESDQPVRHVAAGLGFADAYFFSRQFRQVLGESPRGYRSRRRPPAG